MWKLSQKSSNSQQTQVFIKWKPNYSVFLLDIGSPNNFVIQGFTIENIYIIARTRECGAGLTSLRDDHLSILSNIRNEEENRRNTGDGGDKGIEERITAVTESLQLLDVGVAESGVMLSLASHFDTLEADRSMARLEMRRVKVSFL